VNRDDVKKAADALGRLEALEEALDSIHFRPHGAFPISFFDKGEDDDHQNDHGIKAYYPRETYERIIRALIREEQRDLRARGVEIDVPGAIAPGLYTE
jgi:hypothetical protein